MFENARYGDELDMWFADSSVISSKCTHAVVPVSDLSEPLVVAMDKASSYIWFLNYSRK